MSFILDALKKSENERQRHIGPSLADVQIRRRQSDRPWWVVAVAGLLVINLGVLVVVLTRDDEAGSFDSARNAPSVSAPVVQSSTPSPNATSQRPMRASTNGPANPAVHSLADEAGSYDPSGSEGSPPADLAAAAAVPEGPPMVRPIDPPSVAPAGSQAAFAARAAEENEMLPTHSDLIAGGTSLPELHLDIHVHSNSAAERFVFVNMRKYVEGQTLSEGPAVERITGDGVVLNHRGLRFLLPRQ